VAPSALYWEILGLFIDGEIGRPVCVAEGEELGSNLLHVSRRSGTQHIVRRLMLPLKGDTMLKPTRLLKRRTRA
jgi:hypothetical protein